MVSVILIFSLQTIKFNFRFIAENTSLELSWLTYFLFFYLTLNHLFLTKQFYGIFKFLLESADQLLSSLTCCCNSFVKCRTVQPQNRLLQNILNKIQPKIDSCSTPERTINKVPQILIIFTLRVFSFNIVTRSGRIVQKHGAKLLFYAVMLRTKLNQNPFFFTVHQNVN